MAKKVIVPPVDEKTELINRFSEQFNNILDNTKILDDGDGTESVELELEDRIVTIIIDQSGSMTWNDNQGFRHTLAKDIVEKIRDNYPGIVKYNLIKYGAIFANVLFFGMVEQEGIKIGNPDSLAELYFADDEANFAGIRVIRNIDHYPESYIDGEVVSDGFINKIFDDQLIEGQIYYYSVYTYDNNYKFSSGVRISVTPRDSIIPRGVGVFRTLKTEEKGVATPLIGSGVLRDENTIGLWHMDEGEGNVLYDFSNTQADLVLHADRNWLGDDVPSGSSGLYFNKENYAYIDGIPELFNNTSFTFMAWIYSYSSKNDYCFFFR